MAFIKYVPLGLQNGQGGRRKVVGLALGLAALVLLGATLATVLRHPAWLRAPSHPTTSSPPNTCTKSHRSGGRITAVCKSDAVALSPGANLHAQLDLPNPYPTSGYVGALTFSSQIVDSSDEPVPLDQVYAHHVQGPVALFGSEGAEMRFSFKSQPLPDGYMHVIDCETLSDVPSALSTQVHLINLEGVAAADVKHCIECWCTPTAPGLNESVFCCADCPAGRTTPGRTVYVQYVVDYVVLEESQAEVIIPTHTVLMDPSGNATNGGAYNVFPAAGPGVVHNFSRSVPIDWFRPQGAEWGLVRCSAHQHIGGQGVRIYDDETGTLICESLPRYGTKPGEPGNEAGYLVAMGTDTLDPPVTLRPGQVLRFESLYDWSQPYGGVMSQMRFVFFGLNTTECPWLEFSIMLSIPHNVTADAG